MRADWSALPWLEPIAARLYACRCTAWLEGSSHCMQDPEPDVGDPSFPWHCAGHPVPTDQPAALALNIREFLQSLGGL